jgi:hypothetical protein
MAVGCIVVILGGGAVSDCNRSSIRSPGSGLTISDKFLSISRESLPCYPFKPTTPRLAIASRDSGSHPKNVLVSVP